jgi:hypothetical protein
VKVIRPLAGAVALATVPAAALVHAEGSPAIIHESLKITVYDGGLIPGVEYKAYPQVRHGIVANVPAAVRIAKPFPSGEAVHRGRDAFGLAQRLYGGSQSRKGPLQGLSVN